MQSASSTFPLLFKNLPSGHNSHVLERVAPLSSDHLPLSHCLHEYVHALNDGADVVPADVVTESLIARSAIFTLHPSSVPYVPAEQTIQSLLLVAPLAGEYFPAELCVEEDRVVNTREAILLKVCKEGKTIKKIRK